MSKYILAPDVQLYCGLHATLLVSLQLPSMERLLKHMHYPQHAVTISLPAHCGGCRGFTEQTTAVTCEIHNLTSELAAAKSDLVASKAAQEEQEMKHAADVAALSSSLAAATAELTDNRKEVAQLKAELMKVHIK